MITYESVCEKLGFDPLVDDDWMPLQPANTWVHDDSIPSPFSHVELTDEEFEVFYKRIIENKDKLKPYPRRNG